jgi:hypothetical protein
MQTLISQVQLQVSAEATRPTPPQIQSIQYAIGFISVVVIIIAGLRMILSGGDPQTLNSARNAIIYAAGGIAIAAIAQIIVVFVLSRF